MNKLAGKELQSLPSQIKAGYSEGAAVAAPLSAALRRLLRSAGKGWSQEAAGSAAEPSAAVRLPAPLRLFKELRSALGPKLESKLSQCQGGLHLAR